MRMAVIVTLAIVCLARASVGQGRIEPTRRARTGSSLGSVTPTPEMWFYEQERLRYEDPKNYVRRNAEFKATQRANRLASMKLYGLSNSRPTASPTPLFGSYAPTWVGNHFDPNRWYGPSQVNVVLRPGARLY